MWRKLRKMYTKEEKFDQVSAVIFEGPDCCGKSTQVDKFIDAVRLYF